MFTEKELDQMFNAMRDALYFSARELEPTNICCIPRNDRQLKLDEIYSGILLMNKLIEKEREVVENKKSENWN